ncbi:hypothetical protein ACFP2F_06590 [Hymenobacter artigasi]|uniref:DUF4251 domain-containing protein n=1 Tax=Hymenobacter artigasi TaxID=2719616 RepID=A0ABX1HE97_9BACT|nr:hypothetical protein [Hymenobacter artigasi]NKI88535.1 hypothetical protein [Hymenobacter artigasi]
MQWLSAASAGLLLLSLTAVGMGSTGLKVAQHSARRPSQGQAAGQFLRAVLRANYSGAYGRLAPEVRQGISLPRFVVAARPLWKSGQRPGRGTAIELYKLGMRLGDKGSSRLFYSFSFAADSSLRMPSELLEVTFRDTASRVVLGFSLRPNGVAVPKKPAGTKPHGR